MITKSHHYFLLRYSPWPAVSSLNSFNLLFSLLLLFKYRDSLLLILRVVTLRASSFFWWFSYRGEFSLEGKDSYSLEKGLKFAIILFISSEVFFFFSFFWSYFHFFLSPTIETRIVWPPTGIESFDPLRVPLINTLILMRSGISITISHHYLIRGQKIKCMLNLALTVVLGAIFSILQLIEYNRAFFSIGDSTFGTTFFMLTGFHGIHVLIGSIFLTSVLYRQSKIVSRKRNCLRFELSSWYWHFVDVVWIFLYFILYYLNY